MEDVFLAAGYEIHFDLYNRDSSGAILRFAPSTNDAAMQNIPDPGTEKVPEPGSLLLLGVGLAGIAGFRRKLG